MTPSWVIIAVPAGTFAVCVAARAAFLALRRRSSDRQRETALPRRIPGLPRDGAPLSRAEKLHAAYDNREAS